MPPDDLDRLRRIAYGPNATPTERADAAVALQELEQRMREQRDTESHEVARENAVQENSADMSTECDNSAQPSTKPDPTTLTTTTEADDLDADLDNDPPPTTSTPPSPRRIATAWLIPIVVGSLALGYVAGLGGRTASPDAGSPDPAASSGTPSNVLGPVAQFGNLAAADSWFATEFSASAVLPDLGHLESQGLTPQDVRLALSEGEKGSVWVGRTSGALCLIVERSSDGTGRSACVDRDDFKQHGLTLTFMDDQVSWFGRDVVTSPPWSSTVSVVSSPGDIEAANAWFASTAPESDEFSELALLDSMGVNPADVRRVVPDRAPWMHLWIARQSAGGFCLIATDVADDTTQGTCLPTEDFAERGLVMPVQRHSVFWDGVRLTVSG